MHVAVEVDDKAVAAKGVADGARLDEAHVDAARGELLEHLKQATGSVVRQLGDDARLVGARARGQRAAAAYEGKARDSVRVVADEMAEHGQVVMLGDAGRGDGGLRRRTRLE